MKSEIYFAVKFNYKNIMPKLRDIKNSEIDDRLFQILKTIGRETGREELFFSDTWISLQLRESIPIASEIVKKWIDIGLLSRVDLEKTKFEVY